MYYSTPGFYQIPRKLLPGNNLSFSTSALDQNGAVDPSIQIVSEVSETQNFDFKRLPENVKMVSVFFRDIRNALVLVEDNTTQAQSVYLAISDIQADSNLSKSTKSTLNIVKNSKTTIHGELSEFVYASQNPTSPGFIFFDLTNEGTYVTLLSSNMHVFQEKSKNDFIGKRDLDIFENQIFISSEKKEGIKHIFAAINGDQSKNQQNDLYIYFSRGVSPLNVYIAPNFDLKKMDVSNPNTLLGSQVGLDSDESIFCPVAVVTCPHDDRFTEITNSCGKGDDRILKFYFMGFKSGENTPNLTIKQQVLIDRTFFGTSPESSYNLQFCPSGDEFTVFNPSTGQAYGTSTQKGSSVHNLKLQNYFDFDKKEVKFTTMHCIKDLSVMVFQGEVRRGLAEEMVFVVVWGNEDHDVRYNVANIYTYAVPNTRRAKNYQVSTSSISPDDHTLMLSLYHVPDQSLSVVFINVGSLVLKIKDKQKQPNNTQDPLAIAISSTNGHDMATQNYPEVLSFNAISEVSVTNKAKTNFQGNKIYNLENLARIEGSVLGTSLDVSSDISTDSVYLTDRVGEANKIKDLNFGKIIGTGGDFFFGISRGEGINSTRMKIGLYKLDDYTLVGKETVLNSVCDQNDATLTEKYAVLALGCHKGADYQLNRIIVPLDGSEYPETTDLPLTVEKVDKLVIGTLPGDKAIVAIKTRFYNNAAIYLINASDNSVSDLGGLTVDGVDSLDFFPYEDEAVLLSANYGDISLKATYFDSKGKIVDTEEIEIEGSKFEITRIDCQNTTCGFSTSSNVIFIAKIASKDTKLELQDLIFFNSIQYTKRSPKLTAGNNFVAYHMQSADGPIIVIYSFEYPSGAFGTISLGVQADVIIKEIEQATSDSPYGEILTATQLFGSLDSVFQSYQLSPLLININTNMSQQQASESVFVKFETQEVENTKVPLIYFFMPPGDVPDYSKKTEWYWYLLISIVVLILVLFIAAGCYIGFSQVQQKKKINREIEEYESIKQTVIEDQIMKAKDEEKMLDAVLMEGEE